MSIYIGCRVKKEAVKKIDEHVKSINLTNNRLTVYSRSDFLRDAVEEKLRRLDNK